MKFILPSILFAVSLTFFSPKEYEGVCTNVHDGDSYTVMLESRQDFIGIEVILRKEEKIRLYGVDTPELNDPKGKAARDMVKTWIEGKKVRIITDKDKREKFGRLLAQVIIGTTNVGDLILEKNLGKEYHGEAR